MQDMNEKPQREPVADRRIEIRSYALSDERMLLEGVLYDDRHIDFTDFSGERVPSGRFHAFRARMEIDISTMCIEDIDVGFEAYPHEECAELRESYRSLKGLSVESGFTRSVLERVGGARACAHLTHLIITMGPACVQAVFTQQTRADRPRPPRKDQVRSYFVDSCYLWRQDGPHAGAHG
jgi:hypothetical protein